MSRIVQIATRMTGAVTTGTDVIRGKDVHALVHHAENVLDLHVRNALDPHVENVPDHHAVSAHVQETGERLSVVVGGFLMR